MYFVSFLTFVEHWSEYNVYVTKRNETRMITKMAFDIFQNGIMKNEWLDFINRLGAGTLILKIKNQLDQKMPKRYLYPNPSGGMSPR